MTVTILVRYAQGYSLIPTSENNEDAGDNRSDVDTAAGADCDDSESGTE